MSAIPAFVFSPDTSLQAVVCQDLEVYFACHKCEAPQFSRKPHMKTQKRDGLSLLCATFESPPTHIIQNQRAIETYLILHCL